MEVRRVKPRVLFVGINLRGKVVTIISIYGPLSSRMKKRKKFSDNLTDEVQSRNGKCFVQGNFDGHVGTSAYGFDGVHGGFAWGERNRNGESVLKVRGQF